VRGLVLALALLIAAAAHAAEPGLPVPPIPPAEPPPSAAPVPDLDVVGQSDDAPSSAVTLYTEINHRAAPDAGLGYAPGAHYQLDNGRRFFMPGIMVHVPLP
jgi:hypothetical protein